MTPTMCEILKQWRPEGSGSGEQTPFIQALQEHLSSSRAPYRCEIRYFKLMGLKAHLCCFRLSTSEGFFIGFLYGRAGDGIERADVYGRFVRQKEHKEDLALSEKNTLKQREEREK